MTKTILAACGVIMGLATSAMAQDTAAAPAAPPAWATSCASSARAAAPDCKMEQSVVVQETGQQIGKMVISVPGAARGVPQMVLLLPLGINIPVGLEVQVDDTDAVVFPLSACESVGCFARGPLSPVLLARMRAGNALNARFSNLSGDNLAITFSLAGFSAAFDAVK